MFFTRNFKKIIKMFLNIFGFDIVRMSPVNKIPEKDQCNLEQFLEEELTQRLFNHKHKEENYWLASSGIQTVLDVGAHLGEFSHKIRKALPSAKIYAFEPLEEPFEKLRARFRSDLNFHSLNYGLGDENTQVEIQQNEYAASSSILEMNVLHKKYFPFAVQEKRKKIQIKRLSDAINELDVVYPVLLKIDVQGYEDKVIRGGGDVIAKAKVIIIEVSFEQLYNGSPLFDDIYLLMKEKGFVYKGNLEQLVSPLDGKYLQADAIFVSKYN
jgi:FkbM family methyltransferase